MGEPYRANNIAIVEANLYLSSRVRIDGLTVGSFREVSV